MEGMSNTEVGGVHRIVWLFRTNYYVLFYGRYLSQARQNNIGTYLTGLLLTL